MFKVIFITRGTGALHTIIEDFPSLDAAETAANEFNGFTDSTMRFLAKRLYDEAKERNKPSYSMKRPNPYPGGQYEN